MKLRSEDGHHISEYMIILALVVLVAIPSVQYMGEVIAGSYGNVKQNDFDQMVSLLDVNQADPFAVGDSGNMSMGSGLSDMSYGDRLDNFRKRMGGGSNVSFGENGRMSASGTESNSVDGGTLTRMMMMTMESLLGDIEDMDIPDDVKASLHELANMGNLLGDAEEAFDNAPASEKNKTTNYDLKVKEKCKKKFFSKKCKYVPAGQTLTSKESQVRQDVLSAYKDFVTQRDSTMKMLEKLPPGELNETVQRLVEQYSRAITNIADQEYINKQDVLIGGTTYTGQTPGKSSKSGFLGIGKKKATKNGAPPPKVSGERASLLTKGGGIFTDNTILPTWPPITRENAENIRESRDEARDMWNDKRRADRDVTNAERSIRNADKKADRAQRNIDRAQRKIDQAREDFDQFDAEGEDPGEAWEALQEAESDLAEAQADYSEAQQDKRNAQYDLADAQQRSGELLDRARELDAQTKALEDAAIAEAKKMQEEDRRNAEDNGLDFLTDTTQDTGNAMTHDAGR